MRIHSIHLICNEHDDVVSCVGPWHVPTGGVKSKEKIVTLFIDSDLVRPTTQPFSSVNWSSSVRRSLDQTLLK